MAPEDGVECKSFLQSWLFTCLWTQILPTSVFRQLCFKYFEDKNNRLSS